MNIEFKTGGHYTLIQISDWSATTQKDEIIITGFLEKSQRYSFKRKGSRKEYFLPAIDNNCLVFEGHGLPLKVDSETNRFVGNARFNFVSDDAEALKHYIGAHCLNPDASSLQKIYVTPDKNREAIDFPSYDPLFDSEEEN